MRTLLLILAVNLATFGVAFFYAGFLSLAVPTEEERHEQEAHYEQERKKGFLHAQFDGWQRTNSFDTLPAHWAQRPQSRCLVYIGLACIAGCVAVGLLLGALG
jgi:hypothetical protein